MATLEIHTVGGGYYLYDIFNYLAAFTGSNNFQALLYGALVAGVLVAAFQLTVFGSARQALTYFIGAMLAVTIGIGPKAKVVLMDSTTPSDIYGIVDNVPWSVAFVGSLTSRTGATVTDTMETLLAAPDDLTYQRSGMMFGSTIVSQAARWRAVTPVIQETLVNFMENCMVDGSNIGLLDVQELGHTGSLETFISSNVPQSLAYYDPVLDKTTTCATGWPKVQQRLAGEVQNILHQKAAAQFADSPDVNLPAAVNKMKGTLREFQDFIGMTSHYAGTSIRQSMLVISLDDAVQRLIASSGNNAAMTAYQAARTEAQTSASYSAVGISALKWVPLLKIVFEALYYAAFPLALVMMMTPLVWTVLKGYMGGFVWLAAWDPLSAILHSILMKASSGYYREAMGSYSDGTLSYSMSFANHLGVRAVEQDVGTIAGYLMMSVPFVATVIMFGAGKVAGLATSMLNVSQGAAVESGREAATGNINLANASMNNFAANKWNTSSLHDAGAHTMRMANGAMRSVNADGSVVFGTGTAQSTGGMSARVGQTIREEVSDRKEAAIRTANSSREEWTSAINDTAANYASFGNSLASSTSTGTDRSLSSSLRETKEAREAHNQVERFAKDHGITVDAAYKVALAAQLGKGTPLSAGADLNINGVDHDRFSKLVETARDSGLTDTVSRYSDAVNSMRASTQHNQGTTDESGERWSSEDVRRHGETYAEAREEANTLAAAESRLYSQGISYDGQLTDAIIDEWRQEGFSEEQIAGFLNPKSTSGVRQQEDAVEQVLPDLLSELGLTRPGTDLSSAYSLKRPEQGITEQRLPTSGQAHQERFDRYNGTIEGVRNDMSGKLDARAEEVSGQTAAVRSEVTAGQNLGTIGGIGKKVVTTGEDILDAGGDVIRNVATWGSDHSSLSNYDRDAMIRTIYGEAANEGELGQAAVAHVIMNRVADPRWGDNPAEVSLQLKQFSAWNAGTGGNDLPMKLREDSPEYKRIGEIVDAVNAGQITDPTQGATHYYSPQGMAAHVAAGDQSNSVPTWLQKESNSRGGDNIRIGGHIFTGRKREE